MKNNKSKIFIVIFVILIIIIGFFIFKNNNENVNKNNSNNSSNTTDSNNEATSNYEASKTSATNNVNPDNNNQVQNQTNTSIAENNQTQNSGNPTETENQKKEDNAKADDVNGNNLKEEEIAVFDTKILTKDPNRQHNIGLTCSTLNNTVVEKGATFSFCNTVGQATSSKGYKEADIFDADGKKKKGLGGGNCQISTTLYNAVLKVPELKVVERHEHSNYVPYIAKGKDAAVAYGSYDFKFKNDSDGKIKIQAIATENNITIKLLKIS